MSEEIGLQQPLLVFANGQEYSEAYAGSLEASLVAVAFPAGFETGTITFEAFVSGAWRPVHYDGAEYSIASVASIVVSLPPAVMAGYRNWRLKLGANVGAERTVTCIVRKLF